MGQELSTPNSERLSIVIAGLTNAGKSSLINAFFQKDVAIVSSQSGTTTDPVTRKIELGPLGPCSITDTAGISDTSPLGQKRLEKSRERISRADLVLFVTANNQKIQQSEKELLAFLRQKKIPFIGVITFCPEGSPLPEAKSGLFQKDKFIALDLKSPEEELKGKISDLMTLIESQTDSIKKELTPVQGIVKDGSTVILVTPIDKAAPKGRLILPQVETIRDLLDRKCSALVTTTENLPALYESLKKRPDLVITDSQAFKEVAGALPPDQSLTSFSILFARKKGDFSYFLKSLSALKDFPKDGKILIMEACSHHRQDDDIGSVKIPNLLKKKFGEGITISHTKELDHSISGCNLVIHCGACMLSRKAMLDRMEIFKNEKVPVLNYGLFLAWANGLFPRATDCLPQSEISEES